MILETVCKHMEPLQHSMRKQLPYNTEKRDGMIVIAVTSVALFLYNVMMFASFMACGTPPSFQQRQKILYNSVMMASLQPVSPSTGMLSFPGALPEARKSKVAFISATVGLLSNSSRRTH